MDAIFGQEATAPVAADAVDTAARKEKVAAMKASLKETVQTSPDFASKLRRLSNSIKVVNTLGYGKGGNIVVDKASPERKLKSTSAIVGYEVKNIGTEPITYQTEVWAMGADGKYEAQPVEATLGAGETCVLTRKFMTILCSRPEISFTLANGKIISNLKKGKSTEELLNSFYFQFSDDTPVNDDRVKKAVDEDVDGQRVIKAEYVAAFGYLNNPKEKAAKRVKAAKVTVQDMMANYVSTLLQQ